MTVLINDAFANFTAWTRFEGASDTMAAAGGVLTLSASGTAAYKVSTPVINIADSRVVHKFHIGATPGQSWPFIVVRSDGTTNARAIIAHINGATNTLEIYRRITSTSTLMASAAFTPAANTDYWVETVTVGNLVTLNVYSSDPRTGSPTALATTTWTITGTDIAAVGAGVTGAIGLRSTAATVGSATIDDFSVDDAPAPTNTVAPAVTGTATPGHTLSCSQGTWTNSPTGYAYQWQADGVDIAGATSSTYTVVSGNVGHSIRCNVTATNGLGTSSPAASNALSIIANAVATDVLFTHSVASDLGGAEGSTIVSPSDVFDSVTNPEALAGDVEYRAIFIKNNHAAESLTGVVVWVQSQTSSPTTDIAIGVAVEAAGSPVAPITDEQNAPTSVTFSAPSSSGSGLSIGTLAPGQSRGLWLRRTVNANTAPVGSDACTLAWQGTPS